MALWDNLGKKASNTTAKAVQQAKVLTETSKMNTLISEEKKKIKNLYAQIGQVYVQIHHDDYEAGFSELMESLTESEIKIQEYEAQIKVLRGVVNCPSCGAELPMGSVFCSSCGATMPRMEPVRPPVTAGNVCTRCGSPLAEGVRFCTSCGAPAAEKPAVVQPIVEVEPDIAPPVVNNVCTNCGSPLEADAAFCTECGTPVSAPVQDISVSDVPVERRCTNCGGKLEPDSLFCTECGTKV